MTSGYDKWNLGSTTKRVMRFGTVNIGSMSGRSMEVVDMMERRKVDVCCLQETRWKGGSSRMLEGRNGHYKFFWQGCNGGESGVGILISEAFVDKVIAVNRVNERLMRIKMSIGKRLVNVISAYAPQVGRTDDEKERFWEDLRKEVISIPHEELLVLGGDLNGHVGEKADGFEGVHGGHGFGRRNVEGETILEFGDAMEMVLCNTWFKKDVSN
jgi:exonuclease III